MTPHPRPCIRARKQLRDLTLGRTTPLKKYLTFATTALLN